MPRTPKPTNFDYLDPDAPRTQRIIEAALAVNVPWHPEQAPVWQPSTVAELAERIDQRAQLKRDMRDTPKECVTSRHALEAPRSRDRRDRRDKCDKCHGVTLSRLAR